MREVIVYENVNNTLWQIFPEDAYETVRDRLVSQLEANHSRWRSRRHPADETLATVYTVHLSLGEHWHTLEFLVDDTTADTSLLVLGVIHTVGKNGIM